MEKCFDPNLCVAEFTLFDSDQEGPRITPFARPGSSSEPTYHAVAHQPRLQAICGCKWTRPAARKRVCAIHGFYTAGDVGRQVDHYLTSDPAVSLTAFVEVLCTLPF